MQQSLERSRNDTRFDRGQAGEPDERGDYLAATFEGGNASGSGSREPSPRRGRRTSPSAPVAAAGRDPFADNGAPSTTSPPLPATASPTPPPPKQRAGQEDLEQDRRLSRNPYAAFLNPPSSPSSPPPPTSSLITSNTATATATAAAAVGGAGSYEIPDNFDSHRPLDLSLSLNGGGHGQLYEEPLSQQEEQEQKQEQDDRMMPDFGAEGKMRRQGRQGTTESEVFENPHEPSEKALGKLRRLSVREGEFLRFLFGFFPFARSFLGSELP